MELGENFLSKKEKPPVLFHASGNTNIEIFEPRAERTRDEKEGPKVFATPSRAMAGIFLVAIDGSWVLAGVLEGVPYAVISDEERYKRLDKGGAIYSLPNNTFKSDAGKGMGDLEWTSDKSVKPSGKEVVPSALQDMLRHGVKVYFVDKETFQRIQGSDDFGKSILPNLTPVSNSVEKNANYEGDHTLLLLERLNNSEIREKLIKSLTREHISKYYKSDPGQNKEDEIEAEERKRLEGRIKRVFISTSIDFEADDNIGYGDFNQTGTICINANARQFGVAKDGKIPEKLLNLTEAHEKGHGIRDFRLNSPLGRWIRSGLDFSKVIVPEEDLVILRPLYKTEERENLTDEEIIQSFIKGSGAPNEIVERMSQLKNYFGMRGNEKFTKAHLDYARKNYIKDMGWPIQIRIFLEAITKDTEKNFLDVINNLGV